jgi:hypothetical protein
MASTVAVAVNAALQELRQKRREAVARVAELEGQQRAAVQEVADVRSRLAEAERAGAGRSTIGKIETQLVAAKGKASEPWAERIDGAKLRARDAQGEITRFVGENLIPLVEALEANGRVVSAKLTAAAQALVDAYREREAISQQITALYALTVSTPKPMAVTPSRAEQLRREADRLLLTGGESSPVLRRELVFVEKPEPVEPEPEPVEEPEPVVGAAEF